MELILIFGFKLTEILSKQRSISVDANAYFKKKVLRNKVCIESGLAYESRVISFGNLVFQ
jgi:hypothetical protein